MNEHLNIFFHKHRNIVSTPEYCIYTLQNWCNVWMLMHCMSFMQCLAGDVIFTCWFNVRIFMQSLSFDAMFNYWWNECVLWNVWALMQWSGRDDDGMFGCVCNSKVLMQCLGVYDMFGYWILGVYEVIRCWCNVLLFM